MPSYLCHFNNNVTFKIILTALHLISSLPPCSGNHNFISIWELNKHANSFRELLEQTCRVANVLKNQCGVKKGDTVIICMPAMPLAVASMLACARIGAVHRSVKVG